MAKTFSRRTFLKKSTQAAALAGLGGCGILLKGCRSKQDFDVIIQRGSIYDGSGGEAYIGDIGIEGGTIQRIGKISSSRGKIIIDANNLAVCPGFIDAHDHTDVSLLVNPNAESAVHQGITTLVSGNCGSSPFPIAAEIYEEEKQSLMEQYGIDLDWTDISGFFSKLEEHGMAVNYATFVGQGAVRGASVGFNDRPPKIEELEKMRHLVEDSMRGGAIGISTGLEYAPGSYAQTEEIIDLCRVAARYGGVYATHMRDEGDYLLESLDESITIARSAGLRLQISHFKVAYPKNWHKIDAAIAKVEEAQKEGISICCDRYPYIAGATGLDYNFPLWARQGTTEEFLARLKDPALESRLRAHISEREAKIGSWDKVLISSVVTVKNRAFEGKSVLQCAQEAGKSPFDFMRALLIEEKNRVGMVIFMMNEENLERILAHPLVGIGCDGEARAPYGILSRGKPHPRSYGTFPRALGKYVRENKIVSLAEMIRKMTSVPAQNFGFEGRGELKPGHFADIVVFDPDKIADKATWANPHQYPEGIASVLVNGQVVVMKGEHTGNLSGKVLRKQGKA